MYNDSSKFSGQVAMTLRNLGKSSLSHRTALASIWTRISALAQFQVIINTPRQLKMPPAKRRKTRATVEAVDNAAPPSTDKADDVPPAQAPTQDSTTDKNLATSSTSDAAARAKERLERFKAL